MNILFICSRNKWRSATAEMMFKNSQIHNVKSAGTEPSAVVRVSAKLILWADLILVMEKKHKIRLQENFPKEIEQKQIEILDIEDNYKFMDEELIDILKLSVEPYTNVT